MLDNGKLHCLSALLVCALLERWGPRRELAVWGHAAQWLRLGSLLRGKGCVCVSVRVGIRGKRSNRCKSRKVKQRKYTPGDLVIKFGKNQGAVGESQK